jgi:hypothetical protein
VSVCYPEKIRSKYELQKADLKKNRDIVIQKEKKPGCLFSV